MVRKDYSRFMVAGSTRRTTYSVVRIMRSAGFTLIELLVAITIIGILTTVSITAYSQSQKRARDGQRKFDLKTVQAALQQYYSDQNPSVFPVGNYAAITSTLQTAKYLKVIPAEPLVAPQPAYYYQALNVDGTDCASNCQDYLLCANIENSKDLDISPQSTVYPCSKSSGAVAGYNYGVKSQ